MKFSQKDLILALALVSSASAFAPIPFVGIPSTTVRFVSTEPTVTDTDVEKVENGLQPEFEAVRQMMVSKMSSSDSVNPALIGAYAQRFIWRGRCEIYYFSFDKEFFMFATTDQCTQFKNMLTCLLLMYYIT